MATGSRSAVRAISSPIAATMGRAAMPPTATTAPRRTLFAQVLDLVPNYVPALVGLGDSRAALGAPDEAAAAFRKALAADPADLHGASLKLAALGLDAAPAAPPAAYVRGLFDDYADRFDKALVETLGYRTPGDLGRLLPA